MFFPRGKAMYENLATSYLLVDALIADLCEGGFSGIVEIVLHDAEGHVIIERGKVAASLLKCNQQDESTASIQELAARSRAERGRVSIYSYTTDVANALARRADSEPLYTQLSTDFADLGKMLAKLAREGDREWLIEVRTKGGAQALIYLKDNDCLIVTPEGDTDVAGRRDLTGSSVLDDLLDESSRAGATFDVYFRLPSAAIEEIEKDVEVEKYKVSQAAMNQGQSFTTGHADTHIEAASTEPARVEADQSAIKIEQPSLSQSDSSDTAYGDTDYYEEIKTSGPLSLPQEPLPDAASQGMTSHLFASTHVAESAGEAEMIEVKRLMGEIVRAVDESIRAVSQQSNFAMHMRAGQLRVADRYPFLDPFGNEFEYLAGEIAFVGKVKPDDFIAGLTEALRIALASALQSVSQPARLRAIAAEDLRSLSERYRSEFEEFGLDQSVERIMEA